MLSNIYFWSSLFKNRFETICQLILWIVHGVAQSEISVNQNYSTFIALAPRNTSNGEVMNGLQSENLVPSTCLSMNVHHIVEDL